MALTKVQETSLYAIEEVASNAVDIGSTVDVSTYYGGDIRIRLGRGTGVAFTVAPRVRIEGTYDSSSPTAAQWVTLVEFQMAIGVSIGSQATSSGDGPGSSAVTLAAGTNFAADDYVFFHHTTIANSEWHRVVSVSGAVLTLQDALINDQAAATVRDQAEQYHALLDLTSIQGLRLVVNNSGSGQAVVVEAVGGFVSGL